MINRATREENPAPVCAVLSQIGHTDTKMAQHLVTYPFVLRLSFVPYANPQPQEAAL